MKLEEVAEILEAEIICGDKQLLSEIEIETACGADLMSDVLAFTEKEKTLLLTGLNNPQVVRTAEMIDLTAIIFVRGKFPPEPTIDLAREKGIHLLVTGKLLYEACGVLYAAGLSPEHKDRTSPGDDNNEFC